MRRCVGATLRGTSTHASVLRRSGAGMRSRSYWFRPKQLLATISLMSASLGM